MSWSRFETLYLANKFQTLYRLSQIVHYQNVSKSSVKIADQSPFYHLRINGTSDVSSGDRNNLMASRWSYFRKCHYVPVYFETFASCGAIKRQRQRHAPERLWNVNSWHIDMTSPRLQTCSETFVRIFSVLIKMLLIYVTPALKNTRGMRKLFLFSE